MTRNLTDIVMIFLKDRGWSQYYSDKYWVNSKTVKDPSRQDYTDYGMDLISAFIHEVENLGPFDCYGMPEIGQSQKGYECREILEKYFGKQK